MIKDITVIVLGHKGMLGHMVSKYLSTKNNFKVIYINSRFPHWSEEVFEGCDFVINCIGAIPQRSSDFSVNWELPIWLEKQLNCKIIHPGTDCEMDDDAYGKSKQRASEFIINSGINTKIIKSSIIGPELNSSSSLLEWFLSQHGEVYGYKQAIWNGITTLEWSKWCHDLIVNWQNYATLNVVSTKPISKFELLCIIKKVYKKNNVKITEKNIGKNKTLNGTILAKNIESQLIELRDFK